jgi:hypothetical protein
VLANPRDVAELSPSRPSGVGMRHAGLFDLSGAHVEMKRELVIEIRIEAPPTEERSQSLDQRDPHHAVRITSAMAPDS